MSRRKYLVLSTLQDEVEPPKEGQHIVRSLGSRGSNIIEVEFPEGHKTLCLLPAKFHKKLWIKRGTYLIVENFEDADARVTGQILNVLYDDHVKQLKKYDGVWPEAFTESCSAAGEGSKCAGLLEALDNLNLEGNGAAAPSADGAVNKEGKKDGNENQEKSGPAYNESDDDSSDDDLPPLPSIQNRKIIEYEVSDSDSD